MSTSDVSRETTDEKVDRLIARVDAVEAKLTTAWASIEPLLSEVLPLVKRIEESPMFRMIAPKKRGS